MALEPLISSCNFFLRSPYPIFNSSLLESSILARDFWLFVRKLKKCFPSFGSLRLVLASLRRAGGICCFCVSLWGSSIPSCWARSHCPTGPCLLPCSSCLALPDIFPPNASEFKFLGPAPVILASFDTLQHLAGSLECCSPTPLHSRRNHKTLPGPNKSPQKHHPTTDSPC